MTRILVTGGTGFAGSHLLEALLAEGYEDIHATSYSPVPAELQHLLPEHHFHQLDLTDAAATSALIKEIQPDQLYHLASFAFVGESFARASEVFQNNVTLQINVLEAVRQYCPSARVLIVGSAEEYGVSESPNELPINEEHPLRPVNPYAVSKVTQDLLGYSFGKSFNLQVLRVRPFNHIGERQTTDFVVPAFISQVVDIENGKQDVLRVGNLTSVRDFTDVKDMVRAYITVMEKGLPLAVYNIGSGQGISMAELLGKIRALAKTEVVVEEDQSRMRPADIPEMVADPSKIKQLGWQPRLSLDETLARVFQSLRNNSNN